MRATHKSDARCEKGDKAHFVERAGRSMSTRQGYIYGMACPGGPMKVGFSINIHLRLQTLRFEFGKNLDVISYVPVQVDIIKDVEKLAHYILRARHVRGEWFDVSESEALTAVGDAIERRSLGERAPSIRDDPEKSPQTVSMFLPKAIVRQLSDGRAKQERIPSVSAAIRQLVERGACG